MIVPGRIWSYRVVSPRHNRPYNILLALSTGASSNVLLYNVIVDCRPKKGKLMQSLAWAALCYTREEERFIEQIAESEANLWPGSILFTNRYRFSATPITA